jgi:hypothetical protein
LDSGAQDPDERNMARSDRCDERRGHSDGARSKAISLAVFIADSRADHTDRAALMASIARMTIKNYR